MAKIATRRRILDECLRAFGEKGCRFTLDDIESGLQMSRRTIYKYFAGKEDILITLIDETTAETHEKQAVIFEDTTLAPVEKMRRLLTVETRYENLIAVDQLYQMEKYFPRVYAYFLHAYETSWSYVEQLLQKGQECGLYKPYPLDLIKTMIIHSMQMLYHGNVLERNGLVYKEALREVVDIILQGILLRQDTANEQA